jgi:Zn-dependent peptidase ImmA (M78 family)
MNNCKEDNYIKEDTKFINMLVGINDKQSRRNESINDLYNIYLRDLESKFPYQAFNTDFNQDPNKTPFDIRAFAKDINLTINEERLDIDISGKLENNIITVNSIDRDYRQNFTIAHEIGHYLLAHGDITEYRRNKSFYTKDQLQREEDADYFAANLLLPASIISKVVSLFKKQLKIQKLSDNIYSTKLQLVANLKYVLDVSEQAVIKRLKALNYLESYIWLA